MYTALNKEKQNIFLLIISSFFSNIASYIFDIGILIYLYDNTKSASIVSGYFISQILPAFLVLFFGITIDKYNKKNLVIITTLIRIGLLILVIFNKNFIIIYLISFMLNLLYEFDGNVINSLIPRLVSKDKLIKISSIKNIIDSVSMILGPILASLIIVSSNVNINIIINIFCYVITFITFIFLNIKTNEISDFKPDKGVTRTNFNLSIILGNKEIISTIIYWALFMFFIGLTTPLEIIMITDTLNQSSSYYGIGNSIEGIGMLLASFIILSFSKKLKSHEIICIGLFISAVGYLIIGLSPNILIYFIGALCVGITASFCPLGFRTAIQTYATEETLGRTFAITRFIVLISRLIGTFAISLILIKVPIRVIYYVVSTILFIISAYNIKNLKYKETESS